MKYVVSTYTDQVKVKTEEKWAAECATRIRHHWPLEVAFDYDSGAWNFICERAGLAHAKARKDLDKAAKRVEKCAKRREAWIKERAA